MVEQSILEVLLGYPYIQLRAVAAGVLNLYSTPY